VYTQQSLSNLLQAIHDQLASAQESSMADLTCDLSYRLAIREHISEAITKVELAQTRLLYLLELKED